MFPKKRGIEPKKGGGERRETNRQLTEEKVREKKKKDQISPNPDGCKNAPNLWIQQRGGTGKRKYGFATLEGLKRKENRKEVSDVGKGKSRHTVEIVVEIKTFRIS